MQCAQSFVSGSSRTDNSSTACQIEPESQHTAPKVTSRRLCGALFDIVLRVSTDSGDWIKKPRSVNIGFCIKPSGISKKWRGVIFGLEGGIRMLAAHAQLVYFRNQNSIYQTQGESQNCLRYKVRPILISLSIYQSSFQPLLIFCREW